MYCASVMIDSGYFVVCDAVRNRATVALAVPVATLNMIPNAHQNVCSGGPAAAAIFATSDRALSCRLSPGRGFPLSTSSGPRVAKRTSSSGHPSCGGLGKPVPRFPRPCFSHWSARCSLRLPLASSASARAGNRCKKVQKGAKRCKKVQSQGGTLEVGQIPRLDWVKIVGG